MEKALGRIRLVSCTLKGNKDTSGTLMNESIDRQKIENGVIQMFKVNMGLKSGEKALILSDIPTPKDWKDKNSLKSDRCFPSPFSGETVADIVRDAFPSCQVDFYPYLSLGRSGVEPT